MVHTLDATGFYFAVMCSFVFHSIKRSSEVWGRNFFSSAIAVESLLMLLFLLGRNFTHRMGAERHL